jgi:hypothetical protein
MILRCEFGLNLQFFDFFLPTRHQRRLEISTLFCYAIQVKSQLIRTFSLQENR